jgi:hypothetical protein
MNVKTLVLLLAVASVVMSASPAAAPRRLKLPSWAKSALKGVAGVAVDALLTCLFDEIKRLGPKFLAKLPGFKMVGQKLIGKGLDKLKAKLQTLLTKAINHAINKLRRVRRAGLFKSMKKLAKKAKKGISKAAKGVKKTASKVAKDAAKTANKVAKDAKKAASKAAKDAAKAAKNAAKFAKKATTLAAKGLKEMQKVAIQLDKLTGGKLSAAMIKLMCPAIAKTVDYGVAAALKFVGWPGKLPACVISAIERGCAKALKAAFKKYRLRVRRRLSLIAKH